jgi:hypothetical protein
MQARATHHTALAEIPYSPTRAPPIGARVLLFLRRPDQRRRAMIRL